MKIIFLDYETYYDKDYSLRKMTPVEYILDPRFQVNGCAVKEGRQGKGFWLDGPDFGPWLAKQDPNDTCMVTFNALFDMCITGWRYNFVPRLMVDTMGVARACRGWALNRFSLEIVARHLGLGGKTGALAKTIAMDLEQIKNAGLYDEYVDYALNDNELNAGIFEKLVVSGEFPATELAVMDMVLRCAIKPRFRLNADKLAEHLGTVQTEKQIQLTKVMLITGCDKSDLMSNDKFAEALQGLGVDPPRKVSPTTGRMTWAFSKTDVDFIELEEHEDHRVQALVAARLGHKSTIEETRTQRLLKISQVTWPGNQQNLLPVPLVYGAAHTHRLGGTWKINMQNNSRGGAIRHAMECDEGHVVIAPDSSQIEARGVAWFCGASDLVLQFAQGADVYSNFASQVFGFPVNKKDHPTERFVGKQAILGLGYGLGWLKFIARLKTDSKNQTGNMIVLDEEKGRGVVDTYRSTFHHVPAMWRRLDREAIHVLAHGGSLQIGPITFVQGSAILPNGLRLFYHNLQQVDGRWSFVYGGKNKPLWGGILLENIIQALARIVVMDAGIRLQRHFARIGVWLNLQAHDELVYIVPKQHAEAAKALAVREMNRKLEWAPGWPLASECSIGRSYGEAK